MRKIIFFLFFLLYLFSSVQIFASDSLVINEFLPHPSSGNKEWIEFYNPDNIDLSNYFIDDDLDFNSDAGSSSKKSLATINNTSSLYPYFEISSFLNNSGDFVVLFSPTGEIIDQYQYTEDPGIDVSIGRFPDGKGEFTVLSLSTKGVSNSPPPTASPLPTDTPRPTEPTYSKSPSYKILQVTNLKTSYPTALPQVQSPTPSYKKVLGEKNQPALKLFTDEKISTSPSKTENEKRPNEVKVLNTSQNNSAKILITAGIALIIVCGIMFGGLFWKKLREKNNE